MQIELNNAVVIREINIVWTDVFLFWIWNENKYVDVSYRGKGSDWQIADLLIHLETSLAEGRGNTDINWEGRDEMGAELAGSWGTCLILAENNDSKVLHNVGGWAKVGRVRKEM